MEELVKQLAEHVALSIELVAILVVTVGTLEAVAATIRMIFTGRSDTAQREALLRYARWLAAGLTFQREMRERNARQIGPDPNELRT